MRSSLKQVDVKLDKVINLIDESNEKSRYRAVYSQWQKCTDKKTRDDIKTIARRYMLKFAATIYTDETQEKKDMDKKCLAVTDSLSISENWKIFVKLMVSDLDEKIIELLKDGKKLARIPWLVYPGTKFVNDNKMGLDNFEINFGLLNFFK